MEKKKAKSATKTKKATKAVAKKVVTNEVVEPKVVKAETKAEVKAVKKDNHDTFKVLAVVILVVALLTWVIKGGSWNYQDETGAAIVEYVANEEVTGTGINELFLSMYYGINYYLVQLVFLAVLGIFYGVVSKTKGYKVLVKKCASIFRGKEVIFTLVSSLIIALFASFTTQPIVTLAFIPVIYSIAKELKINKISAMLSTYGALAIGLAGLTYGTFGITYAANTMSLELAAGRLIRFVILIAGYLLLNFFIVLFNKKHKDLEVAEDHFELAEDEKGGKAWPYALMLAVLFVIAVLGYINYNGVFEITAFDEFHKWLTVDSESKTTLMGRILGNVTAFGTWEPFTFTYIMLLGVIITKFFAKISWNEVLENATSGLKRVVKPIALVVLAYSVFVLIYWSGITSAIVNVFNSGEAFNPYLTALGNAIADFLHIDVEYSGFVFGAFYAAKYAEHTEQILTIMAATAGFVALFVPTSVYMLTGLSLSNLSYKEYLKNIWKFIVAFAIVLCVIFTVMTYCM